MLLALLSLTVLSTLLQVSSLVTPISSTCETLAAGWFAGWHADKGFPLSAVSWDKYNTMIYAFASTTSDPHNLSLNGSNPSLLPHFVSKAHEHGVAAHISVGGWSGSTSFSSNVATTENRTIFAQSIIDFAQAYNLDGINIDWEYPNKQGIGCNAINVNDTQNLLLFLQEIRANPVGAQLTLSAATPITPFRDESGKPSTNVSAFAEVLDYIVIMNYDIWGPWTSAVGPNSPLNDTCAPPAYQEGSAVSAVEAWTSAGMPVHQIALGVASYGHTYNVSRSNAFASGSDTELAAYPVFNATNQPAGDAWDNTGSVDVCGVYEAPGGTVRLWSLIDEGYLTTDGEPSPGIYYRHDVCSQTSYVYNATSEVMVSFDDAISIAAKGKFIKETNLRGFSMWEAGGDDNNILLDSIKRAIAS